MALGARLRHTLVIRRSTVTAAATDDVPQQSGWADLATVKGWIQPKSQREVALLQQAGATVTDHTIFMLPTDVTAGDEIGTQPDDGRRFQVSSVIDAAGKGHHLEIGAQLVAP